MEPTAFDEENGYLNPPPGVSSAECTPLSVWRGSLPNGLPVVVSCWKPSRKELEEINRTGRVWLMVWGDVMMPVALDGFNPFVERKHEDD